MPVRIEVLKPDETFKQPPYRGKIVQGGGCREPLDFSNVHLHFENKNQLGHLIVHQVTQYNTVVFEIHNSASDDGTHEMENCKTACFELSNAERMELAIYLLSTVEVKKW